MRVALVGATLFVFLEGVYNRLKYSIFILIFFIACGGSFAQKKGQKKDQMDSVFVKGKSILILGDSSIYIENDTTIVLPDSVAIKMRRDEAKRSDEFYQRLKEKFYKRRFTKELYKLLFNDPPKTEPQKTVKTPEKINDNFEHYTGKRIRKVNVKKMEVFGTSIRDTTKNVDSWAINLANDLHTSTRTRIIKNNIFFEEGDEVDPDLIADSERVLRQLPYVRDARIYLIPREGTDEVDALVIVKDIWSIGAEFSYSDVERFDVTLVDKNFLGLGHEFRNEFLFDSQNTPKVGYSGTYTINNIYNTFITGELYYARSEPLDRIGGSIYRNFITPETKHAGGFTLLEEKRRLTRIFPDTTITFFSKYNLQDIWLGRSFIIDEEEDARTNLVLAGSYSSVDFLDRPLVESDTNQQFFDYNRYLFSVGLTKRAYEKSSLIAGFGRTEDIPVGYLIEATLGKEVNEFYSRTYLGYRLAYGRYFDRIGYLKSAVSLGGYVRNKRMEQGVFNMQFQYFSHLYRFNRTSYRQFFSLSYSNGIRRFENEFVDINDERGVRGLDYVFLRGTSKLAFSAETVAFTPLYFLGFRFAPFLFLDFAVVNENSSKLLKNQLYQGYGIGLRLRNENLAFNTFQIRLAWYPVLPPENTQFGFDISGRNSTGITDFRTGEPAIIQFE